MAERRCPICEAPIKGREDKVFCSANCKSMDQYERKKKKETFYFEVDRQLKINRKLLKKYNLAGMTSLRREILDKQGFDSNFFTHYWKNKKGDVYFFCYDYGFLKISEIFNGVKKSKYLIVEYQDYMK